MSWFYYDTPKRRSLRKGVCLRVKDIPDTIFDKIKKYIPVKKYPQIGDTYIDFIKVSEILPKSEVMLEIWSHEMKVMEPNIPTIYSVIHLREKEDPKWICEGDVGRGFKGN